MPAPRERGGRGRELSLGKGILQVRLHIDLHLLGTNECSYLCHFETSWERLLWEIPPLFSPPLLFHPGWCCWCRVSVRGGDRERGGERKRRASGALLSFFLSSLPRAEVSLPLSPSLSSPPPPGFGVHSSVVEPRSKIGGGGGKVCVCLPPVPFFSCVHCIVPRHPSVRPSEEEDGNHVGLRQQIPPPPGERVAWKRRGLPSAFKVLLC